MSEDQVVRHCAPTLAGLKTGNIFNASYTSDEELNASLAALNETLEDRGLRVVCLRAGGGRALIYVYRPQQLQRDLNRTEARSLLQGFGYVLKNPESCTDPDSLVNTDLCIAYLAQRICLTDTFPHEIGLFLGYPPEDVEGFICHKGMNCKICGYWKVYGDAEAARKRFDQFTKCTGVYLKHLECGASLKKLAVAKSAG